MKQSTVLILTACAGVAAYLAGQGSSKKESTKEPSAASLSHRPNIIKSSPHVSRAEAAAAVRALGKYAACTKEFSAENAVRLTSQERLDLLTNGAWVGDYGNQAAMLCGLISILTVDELRAAAEILTSVQNQGNGQAPEVWQTLWQQWGMLDPEGCFKSFEQQGGHRSSVDARNVMTGWLETNASAALSWAKEPGKSPLQASAAALAISRSVNGDLEKLEAAILKLPADEPTSALCLEDYFDLATLAGRENTAAEVYEQLSSELRPTAWKVTAKRLSYGDSAAAKAWVAQHASDPGRDYQGISDLMNTLIHQDSAAAAKWAATLPFSPDIDGTHPAWYAITKWKRDDPEAASQWLNSQSQSTRSALTNIRPKGYEGSPLLIDQDRLLRR